MFCQPPDDTNVKFSLRNFWLSTSGPEGALRESNSQVHIDSLTYSIVIFSAAALFTVIYRVLHLRFSDLQAAHPYSDNILFLAFRTHDVLNVGRTRRKKLLSANRTYYFILFCCSCHVHNSPLRLVISVMYVRNQMTLYFCRVGNIPATLSLSTDIWALLKCDGTASPAEKREILSNHCNALHTSIITMVIACRAYLSN